MNKKIIFLLVGLVLGMCIGFGSWGIHSFTIGKITNEDSTNICNINERNGLVVKADTLTKDDSINIYEIIKLRKEVGQKSAESNKNKNAGEGVQSPQNAEPKVIKGVEEATGYQDVEDTQTSKDKEQTKAKILQLVNKRDLSACRNHEGWSTHLTQTERLAVEAVFNEKGYIGVGKKEFKNLVKGKSFEDWNELLSFKKEVVKIQSDEKKYKKK